jgi:hypothetical protein
MWDEKKSSKACGFSSFLLLSSSFPFYPFECTNGIKHCDNGDKQA